MKVVAFNGSFKAKGNTFQALQMVGAELEKEGIEFEVVHVGDKALKGCMGCNACARNQDNKCIINDGVNEWIQKMIEADGIIFGTPVHFAGMGGILKTFMDRAFYVASRMGFLRHKVGASLAVVRRAGGLPAIHEMNTYITYAEMVMPSSNYWNVVYGAAPGEVELDEEGKQIMRVLGQNMAWLMKLKEAGKDIVSEPVGENKIYTNFIR